MAEETWERRVALPGFVGDRMCFIASWKTWFLFSHLVWEWQKKVRFRHSTAENQSQKGGLLLKVDSKNYSGGWKREDHDTSRLGRNLRVGRRGVRWLNVCFLSTEYQSVKMISDLLHRKDHHQHSPDSTWRKRLKFLRALATQGRTTNKLTWGYFSICTPLHHRSSTLSSHCHYHYYHHQ